MLTLRANLGNIYMSGLQEGGFLSVSGKMKTGYLKYEYRQDKSGKIDNVAGKTYKAPRGV